MKVVLIENPKFFAGLLRMLFGIKKEKQTIG
ncbi:MULTISPECIES: stage V sporulation protein SpoVM [Ruminococcus]|uniref:Stage V sporulation protein SpoVM n=1 Tax=Ruminococcus difficilis TaxID=2763069 RepID=A0A934WUN1_9FIRM|nr:stage V sporulation protein SpoVM [Ruminococcus difficilis]MBQ1585856.1 stage V sporulation protein SpoVM [Ruminococcus sp.]MDO4891708.1 stage V sporulation protein SpoVM [Eubacteriales bacterium]MBK6090262.1 stage V sporulation protein SpoVM [Ruminococcus difficilis]MBQ1717414.1 stage V sporulation protein SpoVM [Ruminococcus sp.]MBQ1829701.1 stage V sporulation protein SpoVM [Ruminococcus sp.]